MSVSINTNNYNTNGKGQLSDIFAYTNVGDYNKVYQILQENQWYEDANVLRHLESGYLFTLLEYAIICNKPQIVILLAEENTRFNLESVLDLIRQASTLQREPVEFRQLLESRGIFSQKEMQIVGKSLA